METPLCPHSQPYSFNPSWKRVRDWPHYEVSDSGLVRRKGRVLAQRQQANGYMRVTLSDEPNGRRQTMMIHRLVAAAFLGSKPRPMQVHHLDGGKSHNCLANLRWVTPRQNRMDGRSAQGSRNGASVLTEAKVRKLRKRYDSGTETVAQLALRFGVSRQTITKIGKRRGWTHI